jgi:signal transduction histidine kinase/CheY-like chemotaxis protein/HPt (histidine-containing phosphotransfer) domain-containing protein
MNPGNRLHSLKFKIIAITLIVQAIMLAVVLGITLRYALTENGKQWEIKEQLMMNLLSDMSRISLITAEYDELQPYIEDAVIDPHIDTVIVADYKDRIVVSNEFILIGKQLPDLENWQDKHWLIRKISNPSGKIGTLAVRFSYRNLRDLNSRVIRLASAIAIVGLIIIGFIATITGKLLTRRLEVLTTSVQRMAEGDLSARTDLHGKDEIAIVGQAFDKMGQSVQHNLDALTNLTNDLEKRVEERTIALQEARDEAVQANRSKSAFLANMSHEIRTPLTAIIGFSESLLDPNQGLEERVESIQTIINSGKHLLQIINDILDLSKIEADRLEVNQVPVSPFEIIEDVTNIITLLAESKGLILRTEYDSLIPKEIVSDPLRFKQILINLCNNAIKFTEEGSVKIKVECDRYKEILSIMVIDTGVGLSAEQIDRLFQPFSQVDSSASRKYGGTGLGLHLSRELALKLGGDIRVESTQFVGSCFTLTLATGPLTHVNFVAPPALIVEKLPRPTSEPESRLTGKVLLAEDNQDNQRLITMLVRKAGVDVEIAENGRVAVDKASRTEYDLILMDIQMPVMNGLDAVRELRANNYSKPIVALTANAMKIDIDACREAGMNDFAAKPIDRDKFYSILRKYLAINTAPSEPDNSPIVSSLLEEEPDIADLLQGFIDRLPATIEEIRNTLERQDKDELAKRIHDLKGVSGNYGYNILFELCQKMEFEIHADRLNSLFNMLERMEKTIDRIRLGLPDNVVPMTRSKDKNAKDQK